MSDRSGIIPDGRGWLGFVWGILGFGMGFVVVGRFADAGRSGDEFGMVVSGKVSRPGPQARDRPNSEGTRARQATTDADNFAKRMALAGVTRPSLIIDLVGEARTNADFIRLLEILDQLDGLERLAAITLLFHKWALVDPLAAFEVLEAPTAMYGGDNDYRNGALLAVMRELAKVDPRTASRIISEGKMSTWGMRSDAIKLVGRSYGALKLDEAVEWAFGLGENDLGLAFGGILEGLLERDPDAAVALLEANKGRLVGEFDRSSQFIRVGRALALKDWKEALRYYERLRDEPGGEQMGKSFVWQAESGGVMAIVERDLAEGLRRFDEISPEGRKVAAMPLARYHAKRDLEGAVAWVKGLQEQDVYDSALRPLIWEWSRVDRDAAYGFVASQERESSRTVAVSAYLQDAVAKDFERTFDLLRDLPEEAIPSDMEKYLIKPLLNRWYVTDPKAAARYAGEWPDLDPELIKRLNGIYGKGG